MRREEGLEDEEDEEDLVHAQRTAACRSPKKNTPASAGAICGGGATRQGGRPRAWQGAG